MFNLVQKLLEGLGLLLSFMVGDDVDNLEGFLAEFGTSWGNLHKSNSETLISLFDVVSVDDANWDIKFSNILQESKSSLNWLVVNISSGGVA